MRNDLMEKGEKVVNLIHWYTGWLGTVWFYVIEETDRQERRQWMSVPDIQRIRIAERKRRRGSLT